MRMNMLSLYIVLYVSCRTREIGTSLSAAASFFDLFDRSPTVDNDSREGQVLVRIVCMRKDPIFVLYFAWIQKDTVH